MEKRITLDDIMQVDQLYRLHLINSISGLKSAHLIGTMGIRKVPNVAIFNSVVHIGSSPPYLGFILRPLTVPRHTYHNIKATGYFTINLVHEDILRQAHQTSANYAENQSEFEACRLTPQFTDTHPAPYVQECHVKIGLQWVEEHRINANDTILIVGKIVEVLLPEEALLVSGHLNPEDWKTMAVCGLDSYYRAERVARLTYARPGEGTKEH